MSSEFYRHLEKMADIMFNERAADAQPKPKVTIDELVRRRDSVVKFAGKKYRVTVREV